MLKWKLMLTTLPYVAAVLALKLLLQTVFGFQGLLEFTDMGLVLTASAFLMGFMLSGVMSDFKESEKLPGEIACILETMEDHFRQAHAAKPGVDLAGLVAEVRNLLVAVEAWLLSKAPRADIYVSLETLLPSLQRLERLGAGQAASKVLGELHTLRKSVTRVSVISRTSFLQSGYALLDTLVSVTVGLLLISRFKTLLAECVLCTVVPLIYVYMVRLIRDIDDPFEYSVSGARGAAEVDLFPIEEYRLRLQARITRDAALPMSELAEARASA